ncbi:MAG: MFS transporter [Deltaproteobacteria bacterium]|nr:MFS transporter [Deltaproteobacteria bacterium]
MNKFLEKYLKIYPHEVTKFIWLSSIFFVIFLGFAFFRNYVDASFLKRYGPQYIPIMLVINALLTFVVFGAANRLNRIFLDHTILSWLLNFCGASVLILYFMVRADIPVAYPILYQILNLLDSILLVYLWNVAGDLFDARQGKRLFPYVTAAQVLASTIGSFGTGPFTAFVGQDPTLVLFAIVSGGVGIFMLVSGRKFCGQLTPKSVSTKAQTKKLTEIPGLIAKYPIVRYLIVTGLIPNILLPIFSYQFSVIANHTFTSEQTLITFLSVFRGLTTSVSFVLLFFMGRVYQSMGLANASLVQPLNFAALFGSLVMFFNIYVAAYGQFTSLLIQRAVAGPINKVFFNIVPSDLISWSRTFIRGTVLKVGMLTGSMIMIILKPVMIPEQFSFIAVGLSLFWLYETFVFRKHYKKTLKQVIVEKEIDFDQIESVRGMDSGTATVQLGPLSVEERSTKIDTEMLRVAPPKIDPDTALRLLYDDSPGTRAEAALVFACYRDVRAVGRLVELLDDMDEEPRKAAIEALMAYKEEILPFLEVSLLNAPIRTKQGILEVIRLSGLKNFEMIPFLGQELGLAYSNLVAIHVLGSMPKSSSVDMLKEYLEELNDETLSLIFYALWVYHADMRLMYQALQSETASIAVELVENSIEKEIVPYLIPLIEDIPLHEKIDRGRKLFPLIRNDTFERVLTFLANSGDKLTKILALFVIGECQLSKTFMPTIEFHRNDEDEDVLQVVDYSLKRINNEVADMPDMIEKN